MWKGTELQEVVCVGSSVAGVRGGCPHWLEIQLDRQLWPDSGELGLHVKGRAAEP